MGWTKLADVKGTGTNTFTTPNMDSSGADFFLATWTDALAASPPALTDSRGLTWTQAVRYDPVGSTTSNVYFSWNANGGAAHNFTLTGTAQFASLQVSAWSGSQIASSPFDQSNNNLQFGGTTVSTGSVTPTTNDQLVATHLSFGNQVADATIDGGFTTPGYGDLGSGGVYIGSERSYLIQTTATAANPTWTVGTAANLYTVITTFKAGPPTTPGLPILLGEPTLGGSFF